MFKLVLSEPGIFKTSFDAISSIVEEVQIEVDSDGLRLNAIDRSHITYVHLELKPTLFDIFECDKPIKLNLDTGELMKVLKRSKSDDVMELSVDAGNLIITFEGQVKKTFKIKLIDLDDDAPAPPKIEYPVTIPIPIKTLKESIQDIEIVAGRVVISVDENNLTLTADGDFSDAIVEYLHGEKVEEPVRSVFTVEHIKEMLKAEKFADKTSISLGDDMPLTVSLELSDNQGELTFLLAPRIEDE
ncbi:MAG: proliferating cell nuclear antigen (pcna) [Methanosphaera sp. rholeuAM270]|nr:MAG: proliferating cell nuclear antigen (pcna) [Methanosphaera sp. rholeuAM270]